MEQEMRLQTLQPQEIRSTSETMQPQPSALAGLFPVPVQRLW